MESFIRRRRRKLLSRIGDWNIIITVRTAGWIYMTPAAFTLSYIAFASPVAQFQQYTTEQVGNSLIAVGT